ncbi:DNA-binding transcriptional LysR family regulator [Paraburkholderia sp. GAS448]|uniref:LysR family transcriptional regulator n=1 Tax=Paraburkholderia sp. GAS448 TaxID=3035136 RepID=UPI003D1D53C6
MDIEGFDLNLLVAFDALMAERHVTRAAARIGISQPAMSAALARLRSATGDQLFVRSSHGLAPTPRASDLALPLRQALETVRTALQLEPAFDQATSNHVFTLALADHPAYLLLPQLAARLSVDAPGIDLRARSFVDRRDAIALLDSGDVDLAIGVAPGNETRILHHPLFEEPFVGIARAGSPASSSFDTVDDFVAATHVLVSPEADDKGVVDIALAEIGRVRRIGVSVAHPYIAPIVVAETGYIATVMYGVAAHCSVVERLSIHRLPIQVAPVTFHLLWNRRTDAHPAHRWLRSLLIELAEPIRETGAR